MDVVIFGEQKKKKEKGREVLLNRGTIQLQ